MRLGPHVAQIFGWRNGMEGKNMHHLWLGEKGEENKYGDFARQTFGRRESLPAEGVGPSTD